MNKTEIHGNCSIVIRTPAYIPQPSEQEPTATSTSQSVSSEFQQSKTEIKKKLLNNRFKVYYRLLRPSTGAQSDKWVFYYCQDDSFEFKTFFGERVFQESRLFKKTSESVGFVKGKLLESTENEEDKEDPMTKIIDNVLFNSPSNTKNTNEDTEMIEEADYKPKSKNLKNKIEKKDIETQVSPKEFGDKDSELKSLDELKGIVFIKVKLLYIDILSNLVNFLL
jgi:hypothetical protein